MLLSLWIVIGLLQSNADVPKKLPPPKERGENLYKDLCWQCHGTKGKGDGPISSMLKTEVPNIAGEQSTNEKTLIDIIQQGKGAMPAYEQLIDRHDARRILQWLENPVPQKKEKDKKKDKSDKKDKEKKNNESKKKDKAKK